jgi:hypothetical protein
MRLPPPADLERRCIALAMLDALLSPDWEYRYYSFNRQWDPAAGTRMASMRNGEGDEYFALFYPDGSAAIKGFAHESRALRGQLSIAGVLDGIPARFASFVDEPAFGMEATTFCWWNAGDGWQRSASIRPEDLAEDGSDELLAHLVGTAEDYASFVADYYEKQVPADVIARFFAHEPLSDALAAALHPDVDLDEPEDLDEIGYPSQ